MFMARHKAKPNAEFESRSLFWQAQLFFSGANIFAGLRPLGQELGFSKAFSSERRIGQFMAKAGIRTLICHASVYELFYSGKIIYL
jgi:hypothetical protein